LGLSSKFTEIEEDKKKEEKVQPQPRIIIKEKRRELLNANDIIKKILGTDLKEYPKYRSIVSRARSNRHAYIIQYVDFINEFILK